MFNFFKNIIYLLKSIIKKFISYNLLNNIQFFFNCIRLNHSFYKLKINQPLTFNEKILFLKNIPPKPISSLVADKFLVRDYVKEKIGSKYLITLYWSSENINEFDIDLLKRKCIVKLNNGSGANFVINKSINNGHFKRIPKNSKVINGKIIQIQN